MKTLLFIIISFTVVTSILYIARNWDYFALVKVYDGGELQFCIGGKKACQ